MQSMTDHVPEDARWQQHMKVAIREPAALAQYLQLPIEAVCTEQSKGDFPLFVPLPYADRIRVGDANDPLLLQVMPRSEESEAHGAFSTDPLEESSFSLTPGLLQKYKSRALMIVSGACAVHCRYCFRRHFPYQQGDPGAWKWEAALAQIKADKSIREVVLSGGDPLTVVDEQLATLVDRIEQIGHVTRLRIHTRLPIMIPSRVTASWVEHLEHSRLTTVVVVHCNHAQEIDAAVSDAVRRIGQKSITVLNQAVLLKGVNDQIAALRDLSERLIEVGVLPYYLHQLDPVSGSAHFHVPVERGLELVEELRRTLSGYLVPRYVQEIPGRPYKTILQ